jgi:hypothetical protein
MERCRMTLLVTSPAACCVQLCRHIYLSFQDNIPLGNPEMLAHPLTKENRSGLRLRVGIRIMC